MPVLCKNPKYRYKDNVRLTWCNNKVVEAKSKKVIDLENKYNHKIYKGPQGGYLLYNKRKKVYV